MKRHRIEQGQNYASVRIPHTTVNNIFYCIWRTSATHSRSQISPAPHTHLSPVTKQIARHQRSAIVQNLHLSRLYLGNPSHLCCLTRNTCSPHCDPQQMTWLRGQFAKSYVLHPTYPNFRPPNLQEVLSFVEHWILSTLHKQPHTTNCWNFCTERESHNACPHLPCTCLHTGHFYYTGTPKLLPLISSKLSHQTCR